MKKIFVVEDDEGIRELIEYLLITQDYKVQTFPTAEEFKKGIDHQNPDLILLDVRLPDGNGQEICRCLKGTEETSRIPVVLMSAHAHISTEDCATDFIPKPFDVDDLLTRIAKYI